MNNIFKLKVWIQALFFIALFSHCTKNNCDYEELNCLVCEEEFIEDPLTGKCIRTYKEEAQLNGKLWDISKGDQHPNYSISGANLYRIPITDFPTITKASAPGLFDTLFSPITPIQSGVSLFDGRLNSVGVWGPVPDNEWVGFATCIESSSKRTISIGLGADNKCRFKINGRLIALFDNSNTFNFTTWHVYEYELEAGINIIEMEGLNTGSFSAFGAEIYDADLSRIQSWTSTSDINSSLIFSTKDQVGKTFQIGIASGYSCPDGYALDFCSGDTIPLCTIIERREKVKCD
jgi:hypothetical protein